MIGQPSHAGSDRNDRGRQYLESSIRAASPARLRLMLIERGIRVAECLAESWCSGSARGTNEHSIRLLDILNELLRGVVGGETEEENQVCHQVADLYVFLTQHLLAAEAESDDNSITEIMTILEIEAETWRAVCAREVATSMKAPAGPMGSNTRGLNLEA